MTNKNLIIAELEKEQMTKEVPDFGPGDTVVVQVKVKEGSRERLQAFEASISGGQLPKIDRDFIESRGLEDQ